MRKLSRSLTVGLVALPMVAAGSGAAFAADLLPVLSSTTDSTSSIGQTLSQSQANTTNQSNGSSLTSSIAPGSGLIPVNVTALTAPITGGDTAVKGHSEQGNANRTEQGQTGGQAATGGDQG